MGIEISRKPAERPETDQQWHAVSSSRARSAKELQAELGLDSVQAADHIRQFARHVAAVVTNPVFQDQLLAAAEYHQRYGSLENIRQSQKTSPGPGQLEVPVGRWLYDVSRGYSGRTLGDAGQRALDLMGIRREPRNVAVMVDQVLASLHRSAQVDAVMTSAARSAKELQAELGLDPPQAGDYIRQFARHVASVVADPSARDRLLAAVAHHEGHQTLEGVRRRQMTSPGPGRPHVALGKWLYDVGCGDSGRGLGDAGQRALDLMGIRRRRPRDRENFDDHRIPSDRAQAPWPAGMFYFEGY
jgi:hypothetical protein